MVPEQGPHSRASVAERETGQEERGVQDKSGDPAWSTGVVVTAARRRQMRPCHTCTHPIPPKQPS